MNNVIDEDWFAPLQLEIPPDFQDAGPPDEVKDISTFFSCKSDCHYNGTHFVEHQVQETESRDIGSSDFAAVQHQVPETDERGDEGESSEDPIALFQNMCTDIIQKASVNSSLLKSLVQMRRNYDSIKTDAALETALVTFGKYFPGGKKSRRIPVSVAAISRRLRPCSSRHPAFQGRPRKYNRTTEHGYSQQERRSILIPNPKRRCSKKPHNLSYIVENAVSKKKKENNRANSFMSV